jgi:hypothetical protein
MKSPSGIIRMESFPYLLLLLLLLLRLSVGGELDIFVRRLCGGRARP